MSQPRKGLRVQTYSGGAGLAARQLVAMRGGNHMLRVRSAAGNSSEAGLLSARLTCAESSRQAQEFSISGAVSGHPVRPVEGCVYHWLDLVVRAQPDRRDSTILIDSVTLNPTGCGRAVMTAKRLFDLALVTFTAPLTIPLLGLTALVVRLGLGAPVLFWQDRPGQHGRVFRMVKFRSMSEARDAAGTLLPDAARLGRVGRFLRASSLDELPELWNVLRGEMSLVGPRPLLVEYLAHYTAQQARRHDVLPGITGWAQVTGRNALSWDEKFAADLWYVEHRSLSLDLRILFLTLANVLRRKGISAAGEATMPRFEPTGTQRQ